MASPPPSCSSSPPDKHDVFISFRGEDTRDGFTSFLYEALRNEAIQAYMDDHQLERGDEISPTLMNAIEESKISVIIFSENYASSTWCLNELVKILECQKTNGQIVIPVFYRIDPSIVRKQKESYEVAFQKLEVRFKDEMEKVNRWRKALSDAADLIGLDSDKFRPDPTLVRKIVDDICSQLRKKQTPNDVYKGDYGIQERINKIERLLSIGSPDTRIVGICGMGGIGKTTLASAIFQKLYPLFEAHCFLKNVREESAGHRVDQLRNKLLTELFKDRAILSRDTPFVVSPFIVDRFRRKKVLIVLDDVDSPIHLEDLIKGYEKVAPGSRIIVTTRDAQVLKNVTNQIYMVDVLNDSESLALFEFHAFQNKLPPADYSKLSRKVAHYAHGNPLALKVLGSFLHSRNIGEWKSALKMLEMNPDIQNVMRISYEGLTNMQKDMFLDIACFFAYPYYNKFKREEVESILDDIGSSPTKIGISVLIDKSLITVSGDNQVISMNNLLQQMCFAMVCEEHKEPGNRSRLWIAKDISHVLESASGTATIKSITLHLCELKEDLKVSSAAFSKMTNLQYLQIISHENAKFRLLLPDHEHGLEFILSNKLRYFCWEFYPYKSFPSLIPENLVTLNLTDSQLVEFWSEVQPAPALEKLKCLELHGSKNLTQIPNLSRAINIERICLARCTSLVRVPSYFNDLHKLQFLDLTDCSNLIKVEGIPAGKNLRELYLGGTAIEAVPSSIGCLSGLHVFDLHDCKRPKIVPTSICKLKSLQSLDLSGCLNMEKFPEILEPMECLRRISLRGTMIKELPQSSIENLKVLSELDLSCCINIEFLLNDLCFLRHIYRLDLQRCSELQKLPPLPHSLVKLDVRSCENLKSIQELPPSLTSLDASDCKSLETISSWRRTPHIQAQKCFLSMSCSYRFDNCEKLDQNTRNYIIPRGASLEILSSVRSTQKFKSKCEHGLSIVFCYPGDDIPDYFIGHTDPGTSTNIKLPSNWFDANFLGLAFCFVLDLSEVSCEKLFDRIKIECVFCFMNDDGDVKYPCKFPVEWYVRCSKLNSDHVLILYDYDLSYKMLPRLSSIVTKASFDFRLSLHYVDDSKQYSVFRKSDDRSNYLASNQCHKIIKKFGVWLISDREDGGKLMDINQKPKEEETKILAQLSLVSGGSTSHEVVEEDGEKLMDVDQEPDEEEEETRHFAQISVGGRGSTSQEVEDSMVVVEAEEEETSTPSFPTLLNFLKSVLKLVMDLFALKVKKLIPTLKKTNHIPKASTQKEQSFS